MEIQRKLTVAVNIVPHVLNVTTDCHGRYLLSGYEGRFLDLILTTLGYEYDLVSPADKQWGRRKLDGNWTGLIGMVQSGQADMAFNDIAITPQRKEDVNFSSPYASDDYLFAIQKSNRVKSHLALLYPFNLNVWLCLIGVLISMSVFFFFVYHGKKSYANIFLSFLSSVLRQPLVLGSEDSNWKFVSGAWLLFALLISSSYSAKLLSFLTVPLHGETVRNFEELSAAVRRGTHRFFAVEGDNTVPYLINSEEGHLQSLGKAIDQHGWYFKASDTANIHSHISMTTAELHTRTQAKLFYNVGKHHSVFTVSDDELYSLPVAIPVMKNFCCLQELNTIIYKLNSGGFYKKFLDDESFMFYLLHSKNDPTNTETKPVSVEDITGPLILLGLGHILAFITCIVEILVFKFRKRKICVSCE